MHIGPLETRRIDHLHAAEAREERISKRIGRHYGAGRDCNLSRMAGRIASAKTRAAEVSLGRTPAGRNWLANREAAA